MVIDTAGNGSYLFKSLDPNDNSLYTFSQNNTGVFVPVNNLLIGNSSGNVVVNANNITINSNTINLSANALVQPQSIFIVPTCGRFDILNANATGLSNTVYFYPYKGNTVLIGDTVYQIPAGGVIANCQNCYVDGVPNQALQPGFTPPNGHGYYAYVFMNNGVMTLDFSNTGYTPSSITGVTVKNTDPSRTLVGAVHSWTDSPNKMNFYDTSQYVGIISWFNRRWKRVTCNYSSTADTGGGWAATGEACYTLNWTDDPWVRISQFGNITTGGAGDAGYQGTTYVNGSSSGIFIEALVDSGSGVSVGATGFVWYSQSQTSNMELVTQIWEIMVLTSSVTTSYGVALDAYVRG